MLEITGLGFTYPGFDATLAGATLAVPDGQSGFLLGPSGGGKSTLLRCVAGLLANYSGSVTLGGRRVDELPPHERRIGMLFQEPTLFPHLNVWKNVAFGLQYRGVEKSAQHGEALRWLELVGLEDRAEAKTNEISGGQRQRIDLARTLAAKPRAVLLDEPFSALDRDLRDSLGLRVKEILAQQDVPALWVTHDEAEAGRLGDRVWRLVNGQCVAVDQAKL